ncbi:hypothetical protein GYMLUDRAFT_57196 [Collybiopsis luxurians FD-317 M1]|uniref:Uncharacterized protein n=1 Tax=Collybiopsis luxurians FD-317 M1 TaxID=944289 RepID=A0A0D0BJ69_9AGAR|nr:hypothetical protein GYMLUDRAFT_57196 [Collybiopsis luxurians FD-317 M1]
MAQSSSTSSPPTSYVPNFRHVINNSEQSIEERLRRVEKKVQFMIERENLMDFQSDFKGHGVTNIEERLRHLERKVQFIAERENLMEFQGKFKRRGYGLQVDLTIS